MLSEQITPSAAVQTAYNPFLANLSAKDETCLISYENSFNNSTVSMTKQLTATTTTTTSATTISNCSLAPTAISPTNSCSSAVTSPAKGALRKSSLAAANNNNNVALTTLVGAVQKKPCASSCSNDASGRSAALERAYVHDVYENCEEPTGPIRPRVAQFLGNLDAGSVVCDVGCGSGRYLTQCNPAICTVGVDRCYRLSKVAREKGGEVALCDNLELPFRDESFDAVLSLAVVHHFATTERRVSALRELARILRIGGRVIITVWALEQRHRRFESQDVLIPWQPPKNRNFNYSDEEDEDDFLPPYHAYTEDSTNSSRSAGDGDSSSLSSSSPGESCYSFVRRAIQKLAGGRKHPWFLDSWTSKETKNDSSLDYEDAKDLPIELRRLEDFEDFPDPPLSAGLKSRSLGSILNPPPRQIVRSRSSVPSLGGPLLHAEVGYKAAQNAQFLSAFDGALIPAGVPATNGHSPTNLSGAANASATSSLGRRPKLIKQKQSLCDEDYQLPENPFHMISSYNSSSNSFNSSLLYMKSGCYHASSAAAGGGASNHVGTPHHQQPSAVTTRQLSQASVFLRKQSSLNEELMTGNRIREKDRVRKRIQKQMSLNEAFLCRSALFSKRLQVIREGFTSKIKSSTGSLERVTKNGFTKIIQNFKTSPEAKHAGAAAAAATVTQAQQQQQQQNCHHQQHHHHHHHHSHQQQQQQQQPQPQQHSHNGSYRSHFPHMLHKQNSTLAAVAVAAASGAINKFAGPVVYCNSAECASGNSACYCSTYHHGCNSCSGTGGSNADASENAETKARRHSRESGSDSSKDSSLQSDTSIESEDSFASVIFIPKPEQHQQQLNYQQQHQNSNSSSSNSSSSNSGGCQVYSGCCHPKGCSQQQPHQQHGKANCAHINGGGQQHHHSPHQRAPSVPTSPLIMPCPPTPAHSPAAAQAAVTSPPQTVAAVTAAMAILTPSAVTAFEERPEPNAGSKNRFTFDEAHIKQHEDGKQQHVKPQPQPLVNPNEPKAATLINGSSKPPAVASKITRQTVNELPPIPKFRKQQSLQLQRQSFPIVRRSSAAAGAAPSMPKLLSLELFNPATDDLDSDSSEPSSPDSIDSVISAPKSASIAAAGGAVDEQQPKESSDVANQQEFEQLIKVKQQQYHNGEISINAAAPNDIILNDDSSNFLPAQPNGGVSKQPQECSEFAEQLSEQLLREIEDKHNRADCRSLDGIGDIGEYLDDPLGGHKKRNGELRDLATLREELRERRLMLANLSTQPSLQQSPTSSSTSSLSSQTRSFTIHEEDEDEDEEENERSYTLQLYENCKISKFNYKRNRHYNLNPETAYLLQDDGDSSIRDEDELEDIEHDVILEEDEEAVAAAERDVEESGEAQATELDRRENARKITLSMHEAPQRKSGTSAATTTTSQEHKQQTALQNRHSTESWEHSNSSTTSLDSPSQGGGATTHHRYYHVFREGELDALINHHVASLHIVSSYYERASWCVVAEKVQVWTI